MTGDLATRRARAGLSITKMKKRAKYLKGRRILETRGGGSAREIALLWFCFFFGFLIGSPTGDDDDGDDDEL